MMENLKKFEETLRGDRALLEKFQAAVTRLRGEKSAATESEAVVEAAKELGFDVTLADLEKAKAEMQELDPDELAVAGGGDGKDFAPAEDEPYPDWMIAHPCDELFWSENIRTCVFSGNNPHCDPENN